MRYGLRDIPGLLASPGRRFVIEGALFTHSWRLLRPLARLYRGTVVRRTRVVAVVGSYGKTTTMRTINCALGFDPDVTLNRTHGSLLALGLLSIRSWQARAVLEVGIDRPGQMSAFADLVRPNVVVVTAIGSEHGRSLGTLEQTRQEKAEMIRALPRDGLAILNGDDPHVRWMAGQTSARVVTFGLCRDNDIWASDVVLDWPRGMRFTLHAGDQTRSVSTRLLGKHQLLPALAATAVVLTEGLDLCKALNRLASLAPTAGRLQTVPLANGAVLLRDDFKSSIETVDAALDLLAEVPAKRKIVVIGDLADPPGNQRAEYRRVGERLARCASLVIAIGIQRRQYRTGARRAGLSPESMIEVGHTPQAAAQLLERELQTGDVVLIKGRTSQRLERVALALQGRQVGCSIAACPAHSAQECERCPMLERGWT